MRIVIGRQPCCRVTILRPHPNATEPSAALILVFATAAGLIVANIYYSQPLVGLIARDLAIQASTSSVLVSLTQLGYSAGLFLLVPLADRVENRALVLRLLCVSILGLALAALAKNITEFLIAATLIGVASCVVQILVPMAASLASETNRGKTVGNVMAGLLLGILLARPAASAITYFVGWRAVFAIAALIMALLTFLLHASLPLTRPQASHTYCALIRSMLTLYRTEPTLRRRATYQCAAFGAFSLYWTAAPLLLTSDFHLTQGGIAIFALVGAAGVGAAPIAGRLADRGHERVGSAIALVLVMVAFSVSALAVSAHELLLFAVSGVILDLGVQANNIFGQRVLYVLASEIRGRLNGAYMAVFFIGGAIGSAVASPSLATGGWNRVTLIGMSAPALALLYLGKNEIIRLRQSTATPYTE